MRKEFPHPSKPLIMAFGVDRHLTPGETRPQIFVQIWDTTAFDQPCDEGEGGFNNVLVGKIGVDIETLCQLTREYGFAVSRDEIIATLY